MAITRTAMVDDDGSGTTGTIINNAWKTELYNQIDGVVVSPAWIPYALQWTGSPGLFLGDGVLDAKYLQDGKRITLSMVLTGGSTTGWGSGGFYQFSLPVPCLDSYSCLGTASVWAVNSTVVYPAIALGLGGNPSVFHVFVTNIATGAGAVVTPTAPAGWTGAGSRIAVMLTYFTA